MMNFLQDEALDDETTTARGIVCGSSVDTKIEAGKKQ